MAMHRVTRTDNGYLVEVSTPIPWAGIWWTPIRRFRNLWSAEEYVEKRMGEEKGLSAYPTLSDGAGGSRVT